MDGVTDAREKGNQGENNGGDNQWKPYSHANPCRDQQKDKKTDSIPYNYVCSVANLFMITKKVSRSWYCKQHVNPKT